jgi:hypothetical protein
VSCQTVADFGCTQHLGQDFVRELYAHKDPGRWLQGFPNVSNLVGHGCPFGAEVFVWLPQIADTPTDLGAPRMGCEGAMTPAFREEAAISLHD